MNDFVAGDFIRENTHAYITAVKKSEKKDRLMKIGLGTMYILLSLVSLAVI
jgi:hypothetical protein